jgi:hypothetical protein
VAGVATSSAQPLALILGPARRLIDDPGTMSLAERREAGEVVARSCSGPRVPASAII